jgi:hypothetical protein
MSSADDDWLAGRGPMRGAITIRIGRACLGLALLGLPPLAGCEASKPQTGTVVRETQAELDAWKAEQQAPAVGDRPVTARKTR